MSRRLRKTILVAMAFLGLATAAWAYWTTQGSGNASAEVATLSAPTDVAGSAVSNTVSVSWTGSTLSTGTPAQGYYVTRTDTSTSNTSAACGSSASSLVSGTSCDDTSVPSGTYTYTVTAVYHSWTAVSAASDEVTVGGDNTPPTVESINRQTSSPTNASSVQFDVSFSESVTGVGTADFALATSGVSGASITGISGSGASYTVTVNTGSGDGTVGLNLVDDDSIADGAANKLGGTGTSGAGDGSFTGQVYTIDRSAPTVQSISRITSSPTNASSVQFTVTLSESVSGVDASDFALATGGSVSGASIAGISGSGASYTVTVNTGSGDGTVGLNLVDDDSIADGAANKLGGTGTSGAGDGSFTGQVYTIDRSAPTVQSISRITSSPTNASSVQFAVTFSESVTGVGTSDFQVAQTGSVSGASITGISGSGASYTVTVNTGSGDGSVGLNLVDDDSIVDGASNALGGTGTSGAGDGSFTGQTYTIDKTAPSLVTLQMFDINTNGKVDRVTATFSESLASSTAAAPWTLTNVPSGGSLASVSTSGAVATLTITEGAGAANTAVGSFTVALATSATGIRDAAANQSSFAATAPADKAAPDVVSINRQTSSPTNASSVQFAVTFSESVTGVGTSDFQVAQTGSVSGASITGISGSGASYTVTVNTGSGDGSVGLNLVDDDSIVDGASNALGGTGTSGAGDGSFTGQTYTIDKTAPSLVTLQMFDINTNGKVDRVTATFSESLASSTAAAPWTLANVPSGGSLASVSTSGTVATLTITEGAGAANTAVGSFTVALATSATGIRDSLGNQSSFAATAPTDKASPVPVGIADTNGTNDGRFEQNDTMTVSFSESVTGVAASSTVSLVGGNGSNNDTVSMSNLLFGTTVSLGINGYISGNGSTANFSSSALSQPLANQVRVTLAACTGACASVTTAAAGSFTYTPVTSITDAAANAAAGSVTVSIRLF